MPEPALRPNWMPSRQNPASAAAISNEVSDVARYPSEATTGIATTKRNATGFRPQRLTKKLITTPAAVPPYWKSLVAVEPSSGAPAEVMRIGIQLLMK